MTDVFLYDAVRTPFGRYGGALAGTRPDDLAALVVGGLLERHPDLDPRAGRRDRARQRQRRRRGQPQRRPDGRAAGGAARSRCPAVDGQPALRLQPRRHDRRLPADRARRGRRRRRRWRRVDVARAVGAAEARAAVPGRQRRAGLDHARLAAGQPRDAGRVDGLARRGDRAAARARGREPRGPGRVRAPLAPAAAAAWDSGFYDDQVVAVPGVDLARDESIRADTTAGRSSPGSSPSSARTARSPPATPRPSTTAPRRRCSGSAPPAGARSRARSPGSPGWGAAANEPQFFGFAPVEAAEPGAAPRRHRLGRRRRRRAQRGVRRPVAGLRPGLGHRPGDRQRATVARSPSATRSGPPAPASSAPSPAPSAASGERWGVAAICIGVGQGLAVVLENPAATERCADGRLRRHRRGGRRRGGGRRHRDDRRLRRGRPAGRADRGAARERCHAASPSSTTTPATATSAWPP